MTMIYFCANCLDNLPDQSLAELFTHICTYHISFGDYVDIDSCFDNELITELEHLGYIVSTELDDNLVLIRPQGHVKVDDDKHMVCIKHCTNRKL